VYENHVFFVLFYYASDINKMNIFSVIKQTTPLIYGETSV